MKRMNDIEEKFFKEYATGLELEDGTYDMEHCYLDPKVQIGPNVVDFLYDKKYVIEIDGHDYHKTKEQRFNDYQRERYLMKEGYYVIRFMATEVHIDAKKCVQEMEDIAAEYDYKIHVAFGEGLKNGREGK